VNVIKTWYQEALGRGKELATSLCAHRKKSASEEDLSKEDALENLKDLRENGFVTAEEYEKMKNRIMNYEL
jgi:hypothetical protein